MSEDGAPDGEAYEAELRRRRLSSLLGGVAFAVVFGLVGGDAAAALIGGLTFGVVGILLAPWFARRRRSGMTGRPGDGDR